MSLDDPLGDTGTAETLSAADLAALGATLREISVELKCSEVQAALDAGPVTLAQLRRVEQMLVSRAIGHGELAPHVQAAQFMLANHIPEQYGRQAVSANATLRVVVDRGYTLRKASVHEGEVLLSLPHPQGE